MLEEKKLPILWRFALKPTEELIKDHTSTRQTIPAAHSTYSLPSVEALVQYMHTAAGFLVKATWVGEIKNGNFVT